MLLDFEAYGVCVVMAIHFIFIICIMHLVTYIERLSAPCALVHSSFTSKSQQVTEHLVREKFTLNHLAIAVELPSLTTVIFLLVKTLLPLVLMSMVLNNYYSYHFQIAANYCQEVPIFKQFHKNIIGRGGNTIKKV